MEDGITVRNEYRSGCLGEGKITIEYPISFIYDDDDEKENNAAHLSSSTGL